MVLRAQQGNGGAGLGQAVGVGESRIGKQFQCPLYQFQRHAPAAVCDALQGGDIAAVASLYAVDDARQHGGNQESVGDLFIRHQLQPVVRVKGGKQYDSPHRVDRAHQGRDAGDMIGRNADQLRISFVGGAEFHGPQDIAQQVRMAQQRRLGGRCGAAGEYLRRDAFPFPLFTGG